MKIITQTNIFTNGFVDILHICNIIRIMKTQEKDLITAEIVKETDLKHIAIIMDGNRRWAKEKNLPSAGGHKKGVDAFKATLRACKDFGIKYLTVYAFSTENWNRPDDEVAALMKLLKNYL